MSHLMKGKQYGLIMPKAASSAPKVLDIAVRSKKPSIFNQSDSDSDEPGLTLEYFQMVLYVKDWSNFYLMRLACKV